MGPSDRGIAGQLANALAEGRGASFPVSHAQSVFRVAIAREAAARPRGGGGGDDAQRLELAARDITLFELQEMEAERLTLRPSAARMWWPRAFATSLAPRGVAPAPGCVWIGLFDPEWAAAHADRTLLY